MNTRLIFAIALMAICAGCNTQDSKIILMGKLPGLKNETIALVPVDKYFPGLENEGNFPLAETDSAGKFKFVFQPEGPDFYQIILNKYHQLAMDIFLEPGDSIFIEQSSWNDAPQFVINGKGSEKLKHLENSYAIFSKNQAFYDKLRSNAFATELDFKQFIDSIHFKLINALATATSVPDELRTYQYNTVNAERAQLLLAHLESRNYYMQNEFVYFYPDSTYLNFIDSINFDGDFAKTIAAKLLSQNYLTFIARHDFRAKTEDEWWNENLFWKWNYISNQPTSEWNDLLALSTIQEFSFGLMLDDFFVQLSDFKAKTDTSFSSAFNKRLFENNIRPYTKLAPGSKAPDFELPDAEGLLHRLSQFEGSIVYIDFWGTWCYPCIQEIPDALLLQQKYLDKPVVFLYVALEYDSDNIEEWQNFIAGNDEQFGKLLNNKPFPGVHLVAEKQFRNENIKDYMLNFAPTHVLIDHNGKIVKPRAKRSANISDDIDKLLAGMIEKE